MTPETLRTRLRVLLEEKAYRHSPDAPFTLASGKRSPFYFNCKPVTLSGEGFNLLGPVLAASLGEWAERPAAVGGLTLGADALALALAACETAAGRPLDAFVIRKEAKGHGTQRWLEGIEAAGQKVLILDDVCTTGGSTVKAIERARESGLDVLGALVLIDREEENGLANIQAALDAIGPGRAARGVYARSEFAGGAS